MASTRTYKTISVSFPSSLVKALNKMSKNQYRGKSEILRSAFISLIGNSLESETMSKKDEIDMQELIADIKNNKTTNYSSIRYELGLATK